MNHSAVREQKRQIRRAFGPDALEVLTNRDQAIAALQHRLQQLEAEVGYLRNRVANLAPQGEELSLLVTRTRQVCDERWTSTGEAQTRIIKRQEALFRGVLGRLRWLFLGR